MKAWKAALALGTKVVCNDGESAGVQSTALGSYDSEQVTPPLQVTTPHWQNRKNNPYPTDVAGQR